MLFFLLCYWCVGCDNCWAISLPWLQLSSIQQPLPRILLRALTKVSANVTCKSGENNALAKKHPGLALLYIVSRSCDVFAQSPVHIVFLTFHRLLVNRPTKLNCPDYHISQSILLISVALRKGCIMRSSRYAQPLCLEAMTITPRGSDFVRLPRYKCSAKAAARSHRHTLIGRSADQP